MSNVNTQDLLRCRLVTKSWKAEADIELLSGRRGNKIIFWWNEDKQKNENKLGTLKEFTECCYGNPLRKFPCSQFLIQLWDTDNEETQADLVNFFTKCGSHIKNLYLAFYRNSVLDFEVIRKIIYEWTPNLKYFTFEYPYENEHSTQDVQQTSESENDKTQVSAVSLQNLQELSLVNFDPVEYTCPTDRSKLFVIDILASAPNLIRISDSNLSFTKEIVDSGKIRAVDSVTLHISSKMAPFNVQFSRIRPQVTNLTLELKQVPWQEILVNGFFSSLQLILESSRQTLKTVYLSHRLHFNPRSFRSEEMAIAYQRAQFVIPLLEKLEKLTLDRWEQFKGGAGWILPVGFSLQVLFPKLKTLSFQNICNEEENYEVGRTDNPFANHFNSCTTVEKLTISPAVKSFFHLEWINQARVLYPNVRVLCLEIGNNWMELPQLCSSIWKSWNESLLEELSIAVRQAVYDDLNGNLAEKMDQALTGFDIPTCRKLRKKSGTEQSQDNEELKRDSSVLDMTNLKLFQLDAKSTGGIPLFSRVSVIHAFDPMRKRQNLRVVINGAKLQDMIQERNVDFLPDN